jgi:NitT/TauT family transport system substrate-binding protein
MRVTARPAHPLYFAAAVFVCLIAAAPMGSAHAQTQIKFVLDWKLDATAAPILVAIDKGYFKAEGLDVSIVEPIFPESSETANSVVKRIAAGDGEMGFGDMHALIRARDDEKPAPVKAVFVVYNKPGYSVIGRKSRGIQTPGDLEGKKVGMPRRDPASALWKVFIAASGITGDKITTENIGLPVREPMLAAGQVDAVTALSYYSAIDLKDRGVPVSDIAVILMADYGVKIYGDAIMVSEKFAQENPEAVRGFIRAFSKGLRDTIAKPANVIESVLKRDSMLHKDLELDRLKMTIRDNIQTPETKAYGYGGIDPVRMDQAIAQLNAASAFKRLPKADDIFDASFLAVKPRSN